MASANDRGEARAEANERPVTVKTPLGSGDLVTARQDFGSNRDSEDEPRASTSSNITPPYWINANVHKRSVSNVSADSLPLGAITLRDNENSDEDDRNAACWARSVEIIDQTVINGGATSVGAFVVWIIRVETLSVCPSASQLGDGLLIVRV